MTDIRSYTAQLLPLQVQTSVQVTATSENMSSDHSQLSSMASDTAATDNTSQYCTSNETATYDDSLPHASDETSATDLTLGNIPSHNNSPSKDTPVEDIPVEDTPPSDTSARSPPAQDGSMMDASENACLPKHEDVDNLAADDAPNRAPDREEPTPTPFIANQSSIDPQSANDLGPSWKQKLIERQRTYMQPSPTPAVIPSVDAFEEQNDEGQREMTILKHQIETYKKDIAQKEANGISTMSEDIELLKMKQRFNARMKKANVDLHCEVDDWPTDDNMFMSGDEPRRSGIGDHNADTREDTEDAGLREGLTAFLENSEENDMPGPARMKTAANKNRGRAGKSTEPPKTPATKGRTKVQKTAKPKRPTKKQKTADRRAINLYNPQSLFGGQNIFRDAQTNTARAEGPTFSSAKKGDALEELVSSIPMDGQELAKIDRAQLQDALKHFTPSRGVQPDPVNDGWKMKGMKSTLSHYQMLGVSFMRERETTGMEPKDGIVADQMGLGKTVMAIANIVNSWRKRERQVTLVVATASLVTQWEREFFVHSERESCGSLIRYHTGSKLAGDRDNLVGLLANFNIIITTYDEVRRSYPKWTPRAEDTTAEMKAKWWQQHYEKSKGPLHCIKFHRVILDEAQAIKTVDSQTSIACRSLEATYRWALSGTPVQNRLEEFYPYLRFLKAPHTGSLRVFKENFCSNAQGFERLQLFLRGFMLRRTHNDAPFGSMLLALPDPTKTDHIVHFSDVETEFYNVVRKRFVARINGFIRTGQLTRKYSNVLTMGLRLRQIVSHPLLIQDSLRDLLEPEDIAALKRICDKPVPQHLTDYHLVRHLRMMLKHEPQELPMLDSATPSGLTNSLPPLTVAEGGGNMPDPLGEPDPSKTRDGSYHQDVMQIKAADMANVIVADPDTEMTGAQVTQAAYNIASAQTTPEVTSADQTATNTGHEAAGNLTQTSAAVTSKVARFDIGTGGAFGHRNNYGDFINDLRDTANNAEVQEWTQCTRCQQTAKDAQKTSCQHVYCAECLLIMSSEALHEQKRPTCLACETEYNGAQIYVPTQLIKSSESRASPEAEGRSQGKRVSQRKDPTKPKAHEVVKKWVDANGLMLPSAKTLAFKAQVANWLHEDPNVKIIVYTQFTSMIHILSRICEMESWGYVTFHGGHSIDQRTKQIEHFGSSDDTKLMLASLRIGGQGLNLTMASRVILIDLWWNTAVEDQAFARTYRRGQKKRTHLSRFIESNTVDMQIVEMQKRKEREIAEVMENESRASKRVTTEELLSFFGSVANDPNDPHSRPFIYVDDNEINRRPPRFARQAGDEDYEMGDEA